MIHHREGFTPYDLFVICLFFAAIVFVLVVGLGCSSLTNRHLALAISFPAHTGFQQSIMHAAGAGEAIDIMRFEYGPAWEWKRDGWTMDVGIHPGVTLIVGEQNGGPGLGASVMLRPRLELEGVQPYVRIDVGAEWYYDGIETQGTPWGFPLSAGVGFRVPLDHVGWLAIDFSLWHFSNGTKVFGHGFGPNPGSNTDLLRIAIEIPF